MTAHVRRCWTCEKLFVTTQVTRRFCCVGHWRLWVEAGRPEPVFMVKTRVKYAIPGVDKGAPSAQWQQPKSRGKRKAQRCTICGERGHNRTTCKKR